MTSFWERRPGDPPIFYMGLADHAPPPIVEDEGHIVQLTADQMANVLLRLAGSDLRRLAPGEWGLLTAEVHSFLAGVHGRAQSEAPSSALPRKRHATTKQTAFVDFVPFGDHVDTSKAAIREYQRALRAGLETLARGDSWTIRARGTEDALQRERGRLVAKSTARARPGRCALFLDCVYQTLVRAKGLRFCETCTRPFVAIKRQAYCTRRCSQTARTRAYRKRHSVRVRQARRATYKRRK